MLPLNEYNPTFVDTVCHAHTIETHLSDVDCHYEQFIKNVQPLQTCLVEAAYPVGKTFDKQKENKENKSPIFHLTNYPSKLSSLQCLSVYRQYTVIAIHESIASHHPLLPEFKLAPLKTDIRFFTPSIRIDHQPVPAPNLNFTPTFSITRDKLNDVKNMVLPTYFSWMNHEEITRPVDQGMCGSCWAIAAATCLSDVYVVSRRIPNPKISPSYILSCMPQQQCNGGNPYEAIQEMAVKGAHSCITDSWNKPTLPLSELNKNIPVCECEPSPKYFPIDTQIICIPPQLKELPSDEAEIVHSYLNNLYGTTGTEQTVNLSAVPYQDVQRIIKNHLFHHGPVLGGFHVFKNFLKGDFRETNDIYVESAVYQGVNGISYEDTEKDWVGSHAVVIVGWGSDMVNEHMVSYWVVRNSWGERWGHNGVCKIAMYGTTPFQNKISQFEYPSIITTDAGVGITGGVLLMKAGSIVQPEQNIFSQVYTPSDRETFYLWIGLMLFSIVFVIILIVMLGRK
jgi:C1A family cysteine protease